MYAEACDDRDCELEAQPLHQVGSDEKLSLMRHTAMNTGALQANEGPIAHTRPLRGRSVTIDAD